MGNPLNTQNSVIYYCSALEDVHEFASRGIRLVEILKRAGKNIRNFNESNMIMGLVKEIDTHKLSDILTTIVQFFEVSQSIETRPNRETQANSSVVNAGVPNNQTHNDHSSEVFGELLAEVEKPSICFREKCFYFLKDKKSIIVDLARLSFARINESVSDATILYKEKLGAGIKLVRNKKVGYCLKIPHIGILVRDVESSLSEPITYKEDFDKYSIIQTEALKRFSITKMQSEQEILCETYQ